MSFPRVEDPEFETIMLNQSFGDFDHHTIPVDAKIWVAGCGANQAVYTALRFPKATIIGSDLSPTSLENTARYARSLGIANVTLRQENLNEVNYREEFDYILNTGVITIMPAPEKALSNIARALRPNGVLELMVYNRFHRMFTTAFQKAVRAITRHGGRDSSYDEEFAVAKAIAATEPVASSRYMWQFRNTHESKFADALIQPVEVSYTVESLNALVAECGLELVLPCYDQFSKSIGAVWTMTFSAAEVQEQFEALPDVDRWQVANLLLLDKSPLLWFFVRHKRESNDGRYEFQVAHEFLDRRFVRASTSLRNYVRASRNLAYKPSPESAEYPLRAQDDLIRRMVDHADGRLRNREILAELGVDVSSHKAVTDLRVQTTTSLCPYLRAV
jgi:SAM-dependent methyltransferase